MIATKSVSRVGWKLIDCISWVRGLKEQNPPVAVLFEQKNLNTLDFTSNIILFVLTMAPRKNRIGSVRPFCSPSNGGSAAQSGAPPSSA